MNRWYWSFVLLVVADCGGAVPVSSIGADLGVEEDSGVIVGRPDGGLADQRISDGRADVTTADSLEVYGDAVNNPRMVSCIDIIVCKGKCVNPDIQDRGRCHWDCELSATLAAAGAANALLGCLASRTCQTNSPCKVDGICDPIGWGTTTNECLDMVTTIICGDSVDESLDCQSTRSSNGGTACTAEALACAKNAEEGSSAWFCPEKPGVPFFACYDPNYDG